MAKDRVRQPISNPVRGLHEPVGDVKSISYPGMSMRSNQDAQRFMQECPQQLPHPRLCPFGGACHTCPAVAQAKLKGNPSGDKYEQEADRVADRVMRMPEAQLQRDCASCDEEEAVQTKLQSPSQASLIQRQEEPEEEEEEVVQPKVNETGLIQRQEEEPGEEKEGLIQPESRGSGTGRKASPELGEQIGSMRSGGQSLPGSAREFFEPRFGTDFSQVRLHTGPQASTTAQKIGARAFTNGRDIVFRAGEYDPGTRAGRRLLGHELTHVVQQSHGGGERIHRQEAKAEEKGVGKKVRTDAFGKECPNNVVLDGKKAIPAFNKKMLDAGYRTYFGLVSNMGVGPKPGYEACISEVLKVVENTCVLKGKMEQYTPCSKKKHCMKVGKTCGGDVNTKTTFPCSKKSFVDLHRTRRKFNILEGTGKKECKIKCLQRYGCGGKEIGRFYVTRNFKADVFTDGKSKVPITVGSIKKVKA